MGAGIYYFDAPAGDDWVETVYVELDPVTWNEMEVMQEEEFNSWLKHAHPDTELSEKDQGLLREVWRGEAGWPQSMEEHVSRQREDQENRIYNALSDGFGGSFCGYADGARKDCEDLTILAEHGRFIIGKAYTYYGGDMAIVVTPQPSLQDDILEIERYGRGVFRMRGGQSRAEHLALANLKRSMDRGTLMAELQSIFRRVLSCLDEEGLAEDMWFRTGGQTGQEYVGSSIQQALAADRAKRVALARRRSEQKIEREQRQKRAWDRQVKAVQKHLDQVNAEGAACSVSW